MVSVRMKAEIFLVLATLIWGLTFPFIRIALLDITPSMLVFLRGAMAAFILSFFVFINVENRKILLKLMPFGLLLGFLYYASYFTQTLGLQTITSGRSAFLTNITVVFVPLLSPLFKTGKFAKNDMISCGIALLGMFFLTNPVSQGGFKAGDFWTILCAFLFSLQIQFLHVAMWRYPRSSVAFAFLQLFFLTFFAAFSLPFTQTKNLFHMNPFSILSLVYLGVVAMVLTTWIQSRYQHQTSPERASLIYVLEPVFACIFGFIILNEKMTFVSLFGGFLMIISVIWVYFLKLFKKIFCDD
jgi:drug/metabolite transporter (DMT)-like permease